MALIVIIFLNIVLAGWRFAREHVLTNFMFLFPLLAILMIIILLFYILKNLLYLFLHPKSPIKWRTKPFLLRISKLIILITFSGLSSLYIAILLKNTSQCQLITLCIALAFAVLYRADIRNIIIQFGILSASIIFAYWAIIIIPDKWNQAIFWCGTIVFIILIFKKNPSRSTIASYHYILMMKAIFIMAITSAVILILGFSYDRQSNLKAPKPLKELYGPSTKSWNQIPENTHHIYNIVIDSYRRRLFFSEKTSYQIGRIELDSGDTTLSEPVYRGTEKLVLMEEGNSIVTNLQLDRLITAKADANTLQLVQECSDLGGYIDLAQTPFSQYVAAVKEYEPRFFWLQFPECKETVFYIFNSPYKTICSPKFMTCYISGWFFSYLLTEIKLTQEGYPNIARSLFLGPFSLEMALDESHGRLYVTRPLAGYIDVVDISSFRRIRRIPCAPMIRAIACAPDLGIIFISEYYTGIFHIMDLQTGQDIATFSIANRARQMVWDNELQCLFIGAKKRIYSLSKQDLIHLIETRKK